MEPKRMTETAYFISDLHLGARYAKARPEREAQFRRFLEDTASQASHLFILGDLFEFWMEYRHYIPKAHFRTLAALSRLAESGVEVHYLCGNHDFNPGPFFGEHLGMQIHTEPLAVELQGKKMLLLHGDGLAASDWKYRLMKKITVHSWSNHAFKWLHPDRGMELARFLSKLSRDRHGNQPRGLKEYEAACRALLLQGYDIVMHGHTHAAFVREFPEGVYVNSGEWLERMEYISLRDGQCRLESFPTKI
jgi:UDP-2,3-diacylglucosamine hydrolase